MAIMVFSEGGANTVILLSNWPITQEKFFNTITYNNLYSCVLNHFISYFLDPYIHNISIDAFQNTTALIIKKLYR